VLLDRFGKDTPEHSQPNGRHASLSSSSGFLSMILFPQDPALENAGGEARSIIPYCSYQRNIEHQRVIARY